MMENGALCVMNFGMKMVPRSYAGSSDFLEDGKSDMGRLERNQALTGWNLCAVGKDVFGKKSGTCWLQSVHCR